MKMMIKLKNKKLFKMTSKVFKWTKMLKLIRLIEPILSRLIRSITVLNSKMISKMKTNHLDPHKA